MINSEAAQITDPRLSDWKEASWDVEPLSWHAEQQQLRFSLKPYKVQFEDAYFADLAARGVEYIAHPYEEAFDFVIGISDPYEDYEFDDPWYFSYKIEPQIPFFEQLDVEQKLHLLREPEQFTLKKLREEDVRQRIANFLTEAISRDEYWSTVDPNDLLEYYYHRKEQLETSGTQRLKDLRGEQ